MTKNPIPANGMFATPIDMESLMNYCKRFNGSERIVAITCAAMALNLAHELFEQAIKEQSK